MEFMMKDANDSVVEIDVVEGSHVYCRQGDYYRDWKELRTAEKEEFIAFRDMLRGVIANVPHLRKDNQLLHSASLSPQQAIGVLVKAE